MVRIQLLFLPLLLFSLSADPIKIACVGDSITEGSGLSSPTTQSYPARLQRLLGTNYNVRNFGVSGRTLLKKGDFPYWKEGAYTNSHTFNPHIVIIQLGTNDSKPQNWRYGTNFVSDYDDLIASYASLTSSPAIYLCTPCPVYANGAYDIRPGIVATNIAPLVRQIAERHSLAVIELQIRMAGLAELFPDTVHPNSRGMAVMAAVMFGALKPAGPLGSLPVLSVHRIAAGRVAVTWPGNWGSYVAQSTSSLKSANTLWTVFDMATVIPALNSDQQIEIALTSSSVPRYFRLWQP
jgi:lysophospholipase L1-like esterase